MLHTSSNLDARQYICGNKWLPNFRFSTKSVSRGAGLGNLSGRPSTMLSGAQTSVGPTTYLGFVLHTLQRVALLGSFFFILNIFYKLILNLTLFFFPKLTLLAASISLARRNTCAAPGMVTRRGGWRGDDRGADRWRDSRAIDLGAAVMRHAS